TRLEDALQPAPQPVDGTFGGAFRMERAVLARYRTNAEVLDPHLFRRAVASGEVAGRGVDGDLGDALGRRPAGGCGAGAVCGAHHVGPDGGSEVAAIGPGRDLLRLIEAKPHAGSQVGRHPDEPDVL